MRCEKMPVAPAIIYSGPIYFQMLALSLATLTQRRNWRYIAKSYGGDLAGLIAAT
jgi:hypothetical protein